MNNDNSCLHCNGTGENHYHDEDGNCHLKCDYCLGIGKQPSLEERIF